MEKVCMIKEHFPFFFFFWKGTFKKTTQLSKAVDSLSASQNSISCNVTFLVMPSNAAYAKPCWSSYAAVKIQSGWFFLKIIVLDQP